MSEISLSLQEFTASSINPENILLTQSNKM